MEIELNRYIFNQNKLMEFGFVQSADKLLYARQIMQDMFELKITIDKNGKADWNVWDVETREEYCLAKSTAEGVFVGKVRLACEEVFREIVSMCGKLSVFKSRQASLVQAYVLEKHGDAFEYLWKKFPDNAVFRRKDNKKWYGVVLTVAQNRIGLAGEEKIEIIDLRGKPEEIEQLVDGKKYFPAYHMNKKHWMTICLDDSVKIEDIYKFIDNSYILAKK